MPRLAACVIFICCLVVGCTPEPPPRTVVEFMSDRVLLDSVLLRCSADRQAARVDQECMNARKAVERLAMIEEERKRAQREAEFERAREAKRARDDRIRARQLRAEEEAARREAIMVYDGALSYEDITADRPPALEWTDRVDDQSDPPSPESTGAAPDLPEPPPPTVKTGSTEQSTSRGAFGQPSEAEEESDEEQPAPSPTAEATATQRPEPSSSEVDIRSEIERLEAELKRRRDGTADPNQED